MGSEVEGGLERSTEPDGGADAGVRAGEAAGVSKGAGVGTGSGVSTGTGVNTRAAAGASTGAGMGAMAGLDPGIADSLPVLRIRNGRSAALADVPVVELDVFRTAIVDMVNGGGRVAAFFGMPGGLDGTRAASTEGDAAMRLAGTAGDRGAATRLMAAVAERETATIALLSTDVRGTYPAMTADCPQLHWYERELAESLGVIPEGHPWLKPIRFSAPDSKGPAVTEFFRVQGEEIHEVAVGPVHAGVIEPGHFRFQCHGEDVFSLEIALGYQHRGVERAMVAGPPKRRPHYAETVAGDTSIGHATAYAEAVEALAGVTVPARAQAIRAIALELERLANHVGDLGALAGDVGFLPTMSYCGRLRGEFLNLSALLCGNRFGRGLVRPGGVRHDLDAERIAEARRRLAAAHRDVQGALDLLFGSPSVLARFQGTGRLWRSQSQILGLVGVAARACGAALDVRFEFPTGIWRSRQIPVATWHSGDVFARALVRRLEIDRSVAFVSELLADLAELPGGPIAEDLGDPSVLRPDRIAISLVEGWRGEICHVAVTDGSGRLAGYKMVDPSFHNWFGLAMAMRSQQISDFPLCNKSFNLSYCGHDL